MRKVIDRMTKQEFLEGLRRSLTGGLPPSKVNEHVNYYSDYIDSQIRMGVTEAEIMDSLGEPRLIAKTLLGMEGVEANTAETIQEETLREDNYRYFNVNGKTWKIPGWLLTILICVVSFCVLTFIFSLMARLLPYFILVMFGVMIYRFFRNNF